MEIEPLKPEVTHRLTFPVHNPFAEPVTVTLELVKGGDHRLSQQPDLARLSRILSELLGANI